uniref:TbhB n=1 Tax=Burkholderia cepacia TaxID=292 RepID=O07069_BURCE|nr:TbhB [Burkholderia cepacia]
MAFVPLEFQFRRRLRGVACRGSYRKHHGRGCGGPPLIISVGRRVKARTGHILRVRKQGTQEFFPRAMKVADADLRPTECIEIMWELDPH